MQTKERRKVSTSKHSKGNDVVGEGHDAKKGTAEDQASNGANKKLASEGLARGRGIGTWTR